MSTAYSGDGITFPDNSVQATAPRVGMVNRIINGDMRIDQRNAGASVTPTNNQYTLDRWVWQEVTAGKCTVAQSSTSTAGFTNSLLITSTSAYTPLTGDVMTIGQRIEGFNAADLKWGTASAKAITVSFWVRSSLTGAFGGTLRNGSTSRSYPFLFTITSANTFEYKTVVVAGDTSGTWATNNSTGLQLSFAVGSGATYKGTAGAWASASYYSATGATDLVDTSGATFYITGVQLEKGSTATDFEYVDYSRQLQQCYRYFQKSFAYGTAPANGLTLYGDSASTTSYATAVPYIHVTYPVQLRTIPTTVTLYNPRAGGTAGQATNGASDAASTAAVNSGEKGFMVQTSSQVANNWYVHWTATSEL